MNGNGTLQNFSSWTNESSSLPEADVEAFALWQVIILSLLAGSVSFITVAGNLIVLLSFIIERAIRQPTYYFIASLAVSDLLIGALSMPFYTVYLLTGKKWPLGEVICDLWLSIDYTVCLCSIYTVFCITIDRFCSVKIPAKYRNWRTERKVLAMVAFTWVVPALIFFTTIFGWQYFVGNRSVKENECYVQYMDSPIFNCILQLGYFWVTLAVMCALYTGIYRVALNLQTKSDNKQRKIAKLVSSNTVRKSSCGTGKRSSLQQQQQQQQQQQPPPAIKHKQSGSTTALLSPDVVLPQGDCSGNASSSSAPTTTDQGSPHVLNREEESSSPAFPSDTEASSQSPNPVKKPPAAAKKRRPPPLAKQNKTS